jgi:hypothetical protein
MKSMGFLAKNAPTWMFFGSAKRINYNLKGVKMTQNPSKTWILGNFWRKSMDYSPCF